MDIFADIVLSNPSKVEISAIPVRAMAGTGALMLCLPERIAIQLDLQTEFSREVTAADGRSMTVPYAGPVKIVFENRMCFVGALVMGDEVLLGAVPMEDMDLILRPSLEKITVNPASPNLPRAKVKYLEV